ncbi:MAG: lipocalin-like domain-containing protein [Deltaproteobacteria bacterium]|nr:MAG: lipocalin-like domain-containing protein [Deltaproteobacteria bacterium]TMB39127.1 MAG: lipocalin-like domain-containing protein [Deltaproteobacteria bacterium]
MKGEAMKLGLGFAALVLATSTFALTNAPAFGLRPAQAEPASPKKGAKGSALKQKVVGTWSLVSDVIDQDGGKLEPFGNAPKGAMIIAPNGTFSLVITKAEVPKFASNNRATGTDSENKAAVQGGIAYFGSYTVDDATNTVNLHLDGSTFPNWVGNDQKRIVEVSADELRWKNPTTSLGTGVATLVWKRVKEGAKTASARR